MMSRNSDRRGKVAASDQKRRHLYRVYGLTVDSEVELPELSPAEVEHPDVSIRYGEVPDTLNDIKMRSSWFIASRSELILSIDGAARYHISDGKTITIERRLGLSGSVPPADIRLWLLGSAFGALLHQRGLMPLHVSAVKTPSGVWAFTGQSGEGKSTLAAFLKNAHGWELVSDDVSVVQRHPDYSVIHPGPRKLKLWSDALAHFKFDSGAAVRDLTSTEKFQLYLPCESTYQPEPLQALVILESAVDESDSALERMTGGEAFSGLCSAVYRPQFAALFRGPEHLAVELSLLCQGLQVFRFRRSRSLQDFGSRLEPLMRLMQGDASLE